MTSWSFQWVHQAKGYIDGEGRVARFLNAIGEERARDAKVTCVRPNECSFTYSPSFVIFYRGERPDEREWFDEPSEVQ